MPVCELCGKTEFVKQDGMFVCQGCGTKYTLEEARKLPAAPGQEAVSAEAAPSVSAAEVIGGVAAAALSALAEALTSADDFKPADAGVNVADARGVNNYICQGWQMAVERYKKFEHPTKAQLDNMVSQAKECLVALDNAARIEPDKYVQNALIYGNCIEIEDCAGDLDCYEQKDGEWKRVFSPVSSSDLKISGQSESWKAKRDGFLEPIRQEYLGAHEGEVALRAELEAQAAKIQAELDELKDEKKSKGFFNFAEKGEVKERMKPVKAQLSEVEGQIRALDRVVDDYVEERIAELGSSFTILSF